MANVSSHSVTQTCFCSSLTTYPTFEPCLLLFESSRIHSPETLQKPNPPNHGIRATSLISVFTGRILINFPLLQTCGETCRKWLDNTSAPIAKVFAFLQSPSFLPKDFIMSEQDSHQNFKPYNMSAPPPPHFFRSPSFASSNEPTFLSENLTYNEQPIHMSCPEFSPLKKPRNTPCDSFSNQNSNPTMPPPNIQYSFPNQNSNPTNPPPNPPSSFSNQIPNSIMPPPNPPPPRGLTKMFYKTRLCVGFREGTCPHGSNCNFAHGIEDLRKPPPNWKEIITSHGDDQMGNWDEDKMISRRRLCKRFYNGEECPYGERCNFLHEVPFKFREELWRYRDRESSVISVVGSHLNSGNVSDQPDDNWNVNTSFHFNAVNQKNSFWKTKICNKWEKTGQCQYGEKCHYAHGQAELKKFGGINEEETVNEGTTPLKSLPNSVNDVSSGETAARASSMQQKLSKKELFMLKGLNQINRIYGDWIDDLAQS